MRLDRTGTVLLAVLVPVVAATVAGLVLLRPTGAVHDAGIVDQGATYASATVASVERRQCQGSNEDRLPDGTVPSSVACLLVTADLPRRQVEVWAPTTYSQADLAPGTRVVLQHLPAQDDLAEAWVFYDVDRAVPLWALTAAFAVVVVAVAGMRGLRSLVGLALAFGVIGFFLLPALLDGRDPLAVGLVASVAIMIVVLYLAHGFSRRTTTALLGTVAGLGVTAGLGSLGAWAARLSGTATEEAYRYGQLTGQLTGTTMRGVFLCGLVLAGLGVLNDVTITQASAVWELRAADPTADRRTLFGRAMRIGRDHIASTVYTMAFAYAGAALPVLLLLEVYRAPLAQTLTSGAFVEEIVRALVGSIGLVLAIPLTTAVGVAVVSAARPSATAPTGRHAAPSPDGHGDSHAHVDLDA